MLGVRSMSLLLRQVAGSARPSPLSKDTRAVVGSLAAPAASQVQPPARKCQGAAATDALAGLHQALGALRQMQAASGDSGDGAIDAAFGVELRTLLAELATLPLCASAFAAASTGSSAPAATPAQRLAAVAPAGPAPPTARTHALKVLVREELLRELRGGLLVQLLAEVGSSSGSFRARE